MKWNEFSVKSWGQFTGTCMCAGVEKGWVLWSIWTERDPRLDILSKVHSRTYLYLSTYMYLDYTNKSDRHWRALLICSIPAVIGTLWSSVNAVVKQVIRECVKNMGGTHSWVVWTWSTLHFRDISLLFWPLSDPLVWLQRHHC